MRLAAFASAAVLLLCSGPGRLAAQVPTPTPCHVPAYPNPNVPTGLSAIVNGQPIIFYNPSFVNGLGPVFGPPMFRYMLAHECRHHLNGDVIAGNLNPMGMLMITPQIELRADCGAAQYLKSIGDLQALNVAINYWGQAGNMQTGPNYPTGTQRAQEMTTCASSVP